MISSSRLSLAADCPGAFTLPWRDSPNAYSDAGNERHEGDEIAINSGDVPEEYTSRWPGLTWRAESAYAYDISSGTSRHLGYGINRAYGELSPFEVPGTIDAEGRGDGLLVVVDRKGFEAQEPAVRHRQVRFLALAAARHQPAERIVVAIRPELGPMDVADLDPGFDLDVVAHEVRQLVLDTARLRSEARAGVRMPEFKIGRHCRWCPGFDACPKQAELRALVVRQDDDPELAIQTFVDDESATAVYELWRRVGILHKRIGEQIHRHAAVHPIRLSNGKMYGRVDKQGNEKLDGDVVYGVVKSHFGQEVADAAVARQATKKRLESTLKGKRGAVAAVLTEVRALGGATRSAGYEFTEYEPGPRLVADSTDTDEPKEVAVRPF